MSLSSYLGFSTLMFLSLSSNLGFFYVLLFLSIFYFFSDYVFFYLYLLVCLYILTYMICLYLPNYCFSSVYLCFWAYVPSYFFMSLSTYLVLSLSLRLLLSVKLSLPTNWPIFNVSYCCPILFIKYHFEHVSFYLLECHSLVCDL